MPRISAQGWLGISSIALPSSRCAASQKRSSARQRHVFSCRARRPVYPRQPNRSRSARRSQQCPPRCRPGRTQKARRRSRSILARRRRFSGGSGRRSTCRPRISPRRRSRAVKRNKSMCAAGSNSAERSTSLAAVASPRAADPNKDRWRMPAWRSSASCARRVPMMCSATRRDRLWSCCPCQSIPRRRLPVRDALIRIRHIMEHWRVSP